MSKHAAVFQTNTPILEKSISPTTPTTAATTTVEFNGKSSPSVISMSGISVSGLVDEIDPAMKFFDKEHLTVKEKNIGACLIDSEKIDEAKNDHEQLEYVEKPIPEQDARSNKFKAVLQNLQKIRDRLTAADATNETANSDNQNNNNTKTETTVNSQSESSSAQLSSAQSSDCSAEKIDISFDDKTIDGNLFCNKNLRSEKLSPEERLLVFSADEVPLFEASCKLRFNADKLTSKKITDDNLTDNKQESETQSKTQSDNPTIDNSMSDLDNLDALNIVTINPEIKITNEITDSDERKNAEIVKVAADCGGQNVTPNIEQINVTENNNDSKPLLFSLFKGEQSSVDTVDDVGKNEVDAEILTGKELLVTRDLEKSYFKGKLKIPVLNGVNFAAYSGEFVSVTGQSGSGKSTLLHLLGTLDKPDVGEIIFDGVRIDNLSVSFRDKLRNKSIGFIFQFYNLLPEFTAIENVLSPLMIRDGIIRYFLRRREYVERAKSLLDRVGLFHRLRHRPNELSGGEIQRVAIARSLIIEPKLLLADEPTGNLDSASAKEVIRILHELNEERNLTIVMVTHDNSIAATADRVVRMSDGVIKS